MNPLVAAGLLLTLLWWLFFRKFPLAPQLGRDALGQLLELLLYGDSPRLLMRVLGDLLATSLRMGRALLIPCLLSLLALALVWLPLPGYCDWRSVQVGESFLVSVSTQAGAELQPSPGLRLDSAPLYDATHSTSYWRLVATQPGRQSIGLKDSPQRAEIWVGPLWTRLRPRQGNFSILYPEREWWLGDRAIGWPVGLALSCLAWMLAGLVFKCCWCILVRQEGLRPSRKL